VGRRHPDVMGSRPQSGDAMMMTEDGYKWKTWFLLTTGSQEKEDSRSVWRTAMVSLICPTKRDIVLNGYVRCRRRMSSWMRRTPHCRSSHEISTGTNWKLMCRTHWRRNRSAGMTTSQLLTTSRQCTAILVVCLAIQGAQRHSHVSKIVGIPSSLPSLLHSHGSLSSPSLYISHFRFRGRSTMSYPVGPGRVSKCKGLTSHSTLYRSFRGRWSGQSLVIKWFQCK